MKQNRKVGSDTHGVPIEVGCLVQWDELTGIVTQIQGDGVIFQVLVGDSEWYRDPAKRPFEGIDAYNLCVLMTRDEMRRVSK